MFIYCSVQFDDATRGFSMHKDGPLDMRYDQTAEQTKTAYTVVNEYSEVELTKVIFFKSLASSLVLKTSFIQIFKLYGEERLSKEIAKAIVRKRNRGGTPIQTTTELRDCMEYIFSKWYPKKKRKKGCRNKEIHSATKCFQDIIM